MASAWRAANDGAGKRRWFVTRDDSSLPIDDRYLHGTNGRLIRFASYEAARKRADEMNVVERAAASRIASMSNVDRANTYCAQNGTYRKPLTPRQARRIRHKGNRAKARV